MIIDGKDEGARAKIVVGAERVAGLRESKDLRLVFLERLLERVRERGELQEDVDILPELVHPLG